MPYRPPKVYEQVQERRRRDALEAARRQARSGHKTVAAFLEVNEEMSEEARSFLVGLAESFQGVAQALVIRR